MRILLLFFTVSIMSCHAANEASPDLRAAAYQHGLSLLEAGEPTRAIESFDAALRTEPSRADILRAKSLALEAAGRNKEALIERARAEDVWLAARGVEMNPDDAEAWFQLGVIFTGGGNAGPALKCFQRAVRLDPDNAEYQFHRAWYGYQIDSLQESLDRFELAIRLDPKQPKYYSKMGEFLTSAQRYDEALAAFDRAAAIDPAWENALLRARLHIQQDQYEEALAILDQAAVTNPTARVIHRERGWCLHKLGRYMDALASYERAAALGAYGQPIEPWSLSREEKLWYYRAMTLAAVGRTDEARADLQAFVEARPDVPEAAEALADLVNTVRCTALPPAQ